MPIVPAGIEPEVRNGNVQVTFASNCRSTGVPPASVTAVSHAVAVRFNGMLDAYAAAGYYSTQRQVNNAVMARAMET